MPVSISCALGAQVDHHTYLVLTQVLQMQTATLTLSVYQFIHEPSPKAPLNFHKNYIFHEMSLSFCKNKNWENIDLKTFK